jgi:glycine betaine/proline transport system permease protein
MAVASASTVTSPWWRRPSRLVGSAAILAVWIVVGAALRGRDTLALEVSDTTPVQDWFSSVRDWVDSHRDSNPIFVGFLNVIRDGVGSLTTFFQNLISQPSFDRPAPLIGWLGVIALATLAAYAFGNIRVAALTSTGLVFIGLLGLWQQSMDTLAQLLAAVLLSVLFGVPFGLYIGLSRWAERIATPVLDTMQAMPAVVYLAPLALLFLIGPPAAVIVTVVYAMPPVIRLTAHGIREVREGSLEASRSLGATRWQILRTVQLPMARRTIVVGVNQTIMAALSMLMIAVLIGGPGLGQVVLRALESEDIGTAFTGGLAVVVLAIVLDRVTTAASVRTELRYRAGKPPGPARTRRFVLVGAAVLTAVAVYESSSYFWASTFPGPTQGGVLGDAISNAVSSAEAWTSLHLYDVTDAIRNIVTYGFINPLQSLLASSPWYVVCAAVIALAWTLAGVRSAVLAIVCLGLLLGSGLWESAMETLTSVLVATIIVVALGVVFGVLMARNRHVDLVIRPVLDAAQALPAFVYLIPVSGLFGVSRLTAIVAALVFAAPIAIKIVADGILGVSDAAVEAAVASGSSRWQVITKVQLPLARQSIVLAANQGLIYVLSVVTLGGLVGAQALGYLTLAGFSQSDLWGKGFVAGLAIVVLGVLLDRVTQASARRAQERAHGSIR